jgi:hypothetical protein
LAKKNSEPIDIYHEDHGSGPPVVLIRSIRSATALFSVKPVRRRHAMSAAQKVVIVTGASQGIGAGLVKAFRDRGYRVVQDIVDAVMFLESAGFVTGDILHVDGGQNAGDRLN